MNANLLISVDVPTLADARLVLPHAERRLLIATTRRDDIIWLIARTLPLTPDYLFCDLDEAEFQVREAQRALDEHIAWTAAHTN